MIDDSLHPLSVLHAFCKRLVDIGLYPSPENATRIATEFRDWFEVPCPMRLSDATMLLERLGIRDVRLWPGLEDTTGCRGMYVGYRRMLTVRVESRRPEASRIKTLLHEIAEMIEWQVLAQAPDVRQMGTRQRELWANRFAAMVKMPPMRFKELSDEIGLDLRQQAQLQHDTLAGVARHYRDLVMSGSVYYFARFDIVGRPDRLCPTLEPVIKRTGGSCVRLLDVVKTPVVNTRVSGLCGRLPSYNLPTLEAYRVVHPALMEAFRTGRGLFIPRICGAAGVEMRWHDLYELRDLAVLILPYGSGTGDGYFMVAVEPCSSNLFEVAISRSKIQVREDVDWIFSWERYRRPRYKRAPQQPGLSAYHNGEIIDLAREHYPWAEQQPSLDRFWRVP